MMDISRDSADGSELGSRLIARVLLVLEESSATLSGPIVPTSSEGRPLGDKHHAPSTGIADNHDTNGSYVNGTYESATPATDFGAVADISAPGISAPGISAPGHAGSEVPSFDSPLSPPAHPLIKLLAAHGHVVAWTTREDWALDTHGSQEYTRPHVIIVEGQAPREVLTGLCADLRGSEMGRHAGQLVILPTARRNDRARGSLLEALNACGADAFLAANAADAEVLANVRLMATLARTRTELAAAREQLRTQLQTDDQTRLLNRRFFFQAAHRECSRARRYNSELSCLMIEVDHFKRLTAITGFECGEAMLRSVALVLRELTRDSDIVARFDEDKFAVLLPETTIEGATRLREKIQLAVTALDFSWQGTPVPLSVSGGEANRNREIRAAEEAANRLNLDDLDAEPEEHIDGEPLSAREELAELLAAADAALFVARRGVRFPTLVGEYAQEKPTRAPGEDSDGELPTFS